MDLSDRLVLNLREGDGFSSSPNSEGHFGLRVKSFNNPGQIIEFRNSLSVHLQDDVVVSESNAQGNSSGSNVSHQGSLGITEAQLSGLLFGQGVDDGA